MNFVISPGARTGAVRIPASKSQAHRLLICAALGKAPVTVRCDGLNADILATAACLRALGANIAEQDGALHVEPIKAAPDGLCVLPCGESGSTLRFLLPVVGALGADAVFLREGRLPERPLEPLLSELVRGGMMFRSEGGKLFCSGKLAPGEYTLPGNISSQYISALLFALPRLAGNSALTITGARESEGYIAMTENALAQSGVRLFKTDSGYDIPGGQTYALPAAVKVEGDYSSAAFFFCMGALSRCGITVSGLRADSAQGDRAVLDILRAMGACVEEAAAGITVRRGTLHRARPRSYPRALRARCGGGRGDARCECRAAPAQGVRPARNDCGNALLARRGYRRAAGGTRRSRRRTSRRCGERAARSPYCHGGGGGGVRLHGDCHSRGLGVHEQILSALWRGL